MHYAAQLAVWHFNPPPPSLLLFALYLLPSPFFFPRPHDFKPLCFLCPPTLYLQSLIENAALSSRLLPSSFSLHIFTSHNPASSDPTPLISLQFSPVPAARGEKLASWYCYIMKSSQHRAGPPSEPDLQFCFLSSTHAVGLTLRS